MLSAPSSITRDSLSFPSYVDSIDISSRADWTVPSGVKFIIITCNEPSGGVWVDRGAGTATVPSGSTSDGSASFFIPSSAQFVVDSGTAITLISDSAAGYATIACYS